jgi:hypothetical protein
MNNELEKISKEAGVVYLKVLSRPSPGKKIGKTTENSLRFCGVLVKNRLRTPLLQVLRVAATLSS